MYLVSVDPMDRSHIFNCKRGLMLNLTKNLWWYLIGIYLSRIGALQYGQVWSSIQSLHITCSECWSHWNVTSSLDISPLHKEHCSRLFEEFFDADFGKSSFGFWASLGLVSGTLSTELLAELDSLKKNDDKVHIFWEGHKILQNLPLTFDCMYCSQM